MHLAADSGNASVCIALLNRIKKIKAFPFLYHLKNEEGKTALHLATHFPGLPSLFITACNTQIETNPKLAIKILIENSHVAGIPNDIWGKVFSFFTKKELVEAKQVCRGFYRLGKEAFKKLPLDYSISIFDKLYGKYIPHKEENKILWLKDLSANRLAIYMSYTVLSRKLDTKGEVFRRPEIAYALVMLDIATQEIITFLNLEKGFLSLLCNKEILYRCESNPNSVIRFNLQTAHSKELKINSQELANHSEKYTHDEFIAISANIMIKQNRESISIYNEKLELQTVYQVGSRIKSLILIDSNRIAFITHKNDSKLCMLDVMKTAEVSGWRLNRKYDKLISIDKKTIACIYQNKIDFYDIQAYQFQFTLESNFSSSNREIKKISDNFILEATQRNINLWDINTKKCYTISSSHAENHLLNLVIEDSRLITLACNPKNKAINDGVRIRNLASLFANLSVGVKQDEILNSDTKKPRRLIF